MRRGVISLGCYPPGASKIFYFFSIFSLSGPIIIRVILQELTFCLTQ
ncbi:hypothetical protein vBSenM1_45 [Salmonella phage vB_SenM-1]|uniref:Uncharacterized protein n=1 Tax=Salmonella phage vB_SenM-1 TaxID=2732255 RepID=A0A6M4BC55_9CAUD|nr:hypothetical protein vBSenM1_45 [Salmonella phage vB_SenM-1]